MSSCAAVPGETDEIVCIVQQLYPRMEEAPRVYLISRTLSQESAVAAASSPAAGVKIFKNMILKPSWTCLSGGTDSCDVLRSWNEMPECMHQRALASEARPFWV